VGQGTDSITSAEVCQDADCDVRQRSETTVLKNLEAVSVARDKTNGDDKSHVTADGDFTMSTAQLLV